jgi:hypothetical protein
LILTPKQHSIKQEWLQNKRQEEAQTYIDITMMDDEQGGDLK